MTNFIICPEELNDAINGIYTLTETDSIPLYTLKFKDFSCYTNLLRKTLIRKTTVDNRTFLVNFNISYHDIDKYRTELVTAIADDKEKGIGIIYINKLNRFSFNVINFNKSIKYILKALEFLSEILENANGNIDKYAELYDKIPFTWIYEVIYGKNVIK